MVMISQSCSLVCPGVTGIVPQDSLLFEGSIRDNTLTTSNATFEDIVASKVACAHDFIMKQPRLRY